MAIAPVIREEKNEKKHEGNKGKGKRACPKGSTLSSPRQRRASTAIEEDLFLPYIPLDVAPYESVQLVPFKVLPEVLEGEQTQKLESFSSESSKDVQDHTTEVASESHEGEQVQMPEVESEESSGNLIQVL